MGQPAHHTETETRRSTMLRTAFCPVVRGALEAPDTIEIMANPDGSVWIEKAGIGVVVSEHTLQPSDRERVIRLVASRAGEAANRMSPIVSAELPGSGERFEGLLPPVSTAPCFSIRKPATTPFVLSDYVDQGALAPALAAALRGAIESRANILIAGGTSSGKTTFTNALLAEASLNDDRIVILEDTRELKCAAPNVVQLRTHRGTTCLQDLVRSTLRLRPDRIVVGEVRGPEALDLLKAWNTGHPGGITTLHANSAHGALTRLEQLSQATRPLSASRVTHAAHRWQRSSGARRMSEPIPFDEHAERLKIRSNPKPVTRINRKVLIVGAGLGALGLFAAASIALKPPTVTDPSERRELYNVTNTRTPDGLSALPAGYGDVRTEPAARLGPPLAGDLGATVLAAERELDIEPEYITRFEDDFRPNPIDEAERARRLRDAAMAEEAARAPVFFQLQSETGSASVADARTPYRDPALDLGSELLALAALPQGAPTGFAQPADSNLQSRKLAFASEGADSEIYNAHRVEDPASPFQVMAGTLIPASLVTGINSDLPGTIVAQVTQPVYDTVTGQYVLIPQGSRLIGRYQSEVSFGQNRALVTWDRIIFPDGASIVISAPGADAQGFAGLSDRTDHHWDRVFVAAGLATILGIGAELGSDGDGDLERAIRRGTTDTVNQAGQRVVERNLGIQPTIRVRPGWPVRVVVTRDLILRPH